MTTADIDRLAERHIVALSGGKDSTALALRLAEVEPRDYQYICTPTGNELPEMEEHWAKLETLLGKPLMRLAVYDGDGLIACIRDQKCIPNYRQRFCTRILKIEPTIKYLTAANRMRLIPPKPGTKLGRNDPCPCGSGRKYKHCCKG